MASGLTPITVEMREIPTPHRSQQVRAHVEDVSNSLATHMPTEQLQKWVGWATSDADQLDPLIKAPPSIPDEKAKWKHDYSTGP